MYRVTKQFARGVESTLKTFPKREMAEAFVKEKLIEDARMKVETIYRIYDDLDEVIREMTAADVRGSQGAVASSASSQSTGQSQRFSPTPFNVKPQPGGLPHSWIKDSNEKEE